MRKVLSIAIHKVQETHRTHPDMVGGYLTPCECLALLEFGFVRMQKYYHDFTEELRADKAAGICNPTWRYFDKGHKFQRKQ